MKKFFLSTMMFASMQFLSASENNYQNFQTTRTDFDDQGYQAQRKFNNNNNNYNNQIVEDNRLLTDDYINKMDLNKHISDSYYYDSVNNPYHQKYGKNINQFVKTFEYKIDELMSMLISYDINDDSILIHFCHPEEDNQITIDQSFRLNYDNFCAIQDDIEDQKFSHYIMFNNMCCRACQSIKIQHSTSQFYMYEAIFDFDDICHLTSIPTSNNSLNYDFETTHKIDSKIPLQNLKEARIFIDVMLKYANFSEEYMKSEYHFKEKYVGHPGHHCTLMFLNCETINDSYQVSPDVKVSFYYENNVARFMLEDEKTFKLDKDLFRKAASEFNFPDNPDDEDDDKFYYTLSKGGFCDLVLNLETRNITCLGSLECDDDTVESEYDEKFKHILFAKKFIRTFVRTLELMEQKYFDSKKLDDDKKLEDTENSENSNNK